MTQQPLARVALVSYRALGSIIARGIVATHAIGRRRTSEHGAPGATNASDIFAGSAKEAIRQLPKNVNVAVTLSLALGGFDRATITVRSNPALTQNRHCIELEGAFGGACVGIEAARAIDNPKSSALAAYSALSLLKRLASPLQI
jgi:predicted dinucleotide-utilizing enzyme